MFALEGAFDEQFFQEMTNEAYQTVHRIWRQRSPPASPTAHRSFNVEAAAIQCRRAEVLYKRADGITDKLFFLLLKSETDLVCTIQSAKGHGIAYGFFHTQIICTSTTTPPTASHCLPCVPSGKPHPHPLPLPHPPPPPPRATTPTLDPLLAISPLPLPLVWPPGKNPPPHRYSDPWRQKCRRTNITLSFHYLSLQPH